MSVVVCFIFCVWWLPAGNPVHCNQQRSFKTKVADAASLVPSPGGRLFIVSVCVCVFVCTCGPMRSLLWLWSWLCRYLGRSVSYEAKRRLIQAVSDLLHDELQASGPAYDKTNKPTNNQRNKDSRKRQSTVKSFPQ